MSPTLIRLCTAVLLLAAPLAAASTATAESPPAAAQAWSQAAVTKAANDLARASSLLWEAIENKAQSGELPAAFGSGDAAFEFRDKVRLISDEARHIAAVLEKGETRAQTRPSFQRIKELFDDAEEEGRLQFEDEQILSHFDHVRAEVRKLDAFYGVGGK